MAARWAWALVCVAAFGCARRAATPSAGPSVTRAEPWALWPMPNARLPGLPHPHDYDTGAPDVVTDRITGLMWERRVPNQFFTFESAATHCASLGLAGRHDWRLPSRIELVSLIDTTRTQPSIDMTAFPGTPLDWFWTASRAAGDPQAAWYVYFYFGYPKTDDMASRFSVRCVRATRPLVHPAAQYELSSDEVLDVATGLHWRRVVGPSAVSFADAQATCGGLAARTNQAWRVPSLPELLTLIDERAVSPMIDGLAFPQTPGEPFWTSSTFANGHELAWYVRFDRGDGLYGRLTEQFRVRCVR